MTRKQQVANGKNNASVDFSKEDAANDEEGVEAEPKNTTNDSKQASSVQISNDVDENTKTSDENVSKPATQTPTSLKTSRASEASRSASDEVVFIDTRGSVQLTNYLLGNAIKFSKAVTSARPSSESAAASAVSYTGRASMPAVLPQLGSPLDTSKIKTMSPEKRVVKVNVGLHSEPKRSKSLVPREILIKHETAPDQRPTLLSCEMCGAMYMREENLLKHQAMHNTTTSS